MSKIFKKRSGAVTLIMIVVVLAAMLAVSAEIFIFIGYEQKVVPGIIRGFESYYAAESSMEDALLRMTSGMTTPSTSFLPVGNASSSVSITSTGADAWQLLATGERMDRFKRVSLDYFISSSTLPDITFSVGMSSGVGGILLENGCTINGDIWANGPVEMRNTAEINGNLRIALATNDLDGGTVNGDVWTETCTGATVSGNLYTNNNNGCTPNPETGILLAEIATSPDFISAAQIQAWKDIAEAGGVISGDVIEASGVHSYGPVKIDGNMIFTGVGTQVNVTGVIWVTGNFETHNSVQVRLDPSYGSDSDAIVVDGVMSFRNTSSAFGSGDPSSFIILLSTYSAGVAIDVDNSFGTDILYAPYGEVYIKNATDFKHVTGETIHLKNSSALTYDPNLDALFIAEASGGHTSTTSRANVTNWQEVE